MPPQTEASPKTSAFERELREYLECLGLPAEHRDHAALLCREHDFSAARVHLVASRPGRHTGAELGVSSVWTKEARASKLLTLRCARDAHCLDCRCQLLCAGAKLNSYGHMALRRLLSRECFPDSFAGAPLIAQFSSLGSLNEDWLREFRHSMASGLKASGL